MDWVCGSSCISSFRALCAHIWVSRKASESEKTRAEMNKPESHSQESKDEFHLYVLIFYLSR
jgi:hypothetical protein